MSETKACGVMAPGSSNNWCELESGHEGMHQWGQNFFVDDSVATLRAQVAALEGRVRTAEAERDHARTLTMAAHGLYPTSWGPEQKLAQRVALAEAQLAASESARQAAEQRVSELTGPFPDARSNWTKDQWKQLAYLARHRAEAAEGRAAGICSQVEEVRDRARQYEVLTDNGGLYGYLADDLDSLLSSPVPAGRDGGAEA